VARLKAGQVARRKVLVLGGGVGAMVAAHELTATAALQERFEVTVLQPGHRLGGKGASGRDMTRGGRIEEHGLHLWFGFYDTAFRVMKACYEELGRPAGAPLATWEDAFVGCDGIVLYDREGDQWRGFCARWPAHSGEPGDGHTLPGFWDIAELAIGGMLTWFKGLGGGADAPAQPDHEDGWKGWLEDGFKEVGGWLLKGVKNVSDNLLEGALALTRGVRAGDPPSLGGLRAEEALVTMLDGFRDVTWATWEDRAKTDAAFRVFLTCLDTMAATVHGLVEDEVMQPGGSFDKLNDEELCAWLKRHGARDITIGAHPAERAPILRALYDVAFGYREGDIAQADIAAGAAVSDLLRMVFTYRGHLAYKMQAGMGDTVFGPFYEVLRSRGVRFEFFTAATRLGVDADSDLVSEVDVVTQVGLAKGRTEYEPLVDVQGLPCWPSQPDWAQLAGEHAGTDFENERNPLERKPRTLRRGEDFDDVVLGISVGGLDGLVDDLRTRSERFDTALRTAVTVRTQAFQLWLGSPPENLGWAHGRDTVAGCYVEPLDTYCDMSHLLVREGGGDEVQGLAYFCGVLDHRKESHADATDRVYANMKDFLGADLLGLWPAAGEDGKFRMQHLVGPQAKASVADRLEHQYWRANTGGTELYVLSCAGTIDKRLPSGDTGFRNLVAAGDWTRNGIDGGCVEAAAISGVQAAAALIARQAAGPPGGDAVLPDPVLPPTPIGCEPTWLTAAVMAPVTP
jgi:uncharacterized protein with NAD-binding domain and iron-sulfur cluster